MQMTAALIEEIAEKYADGFGYITNTVKRDIKKALTEYAERSQPVATQLPPLTDVMYHAVRGSEYHFGRGETTVIGYLDDDCLDEIWDNINTALRCATNHTERSQAETNAAAQSSTDKLAATPGVCQGEIAPAAPAQDDVELIDALNWAIAFLYLKGELKTAENLRLVIGRLESLSAECARLKAGKE